MTTTGKVFLGLGIGCLVLVLLCCGGLGLVGFFFGKSFQNATSDDPVVIEGVTDSIVEITVPPKLEPKGSVKWVVPFVNKEMLTLVFYGDAGDKSVLALIQFGADLGDNEAMKEQWQDSLREASQKDMKEVELVESEEFKIEINGSPATFIVGKGHNEHKKDVWQAMGPFEGKGGSAMLFMQLDAEEFTKEELMEILHSMK